MSLTYTPTGGIVAAPTTSLPERISGLRNWDYRYCWLRDATFTLISLMDAGYYEEAKAWSDWLLRVSPAARRRFRSVRGCRRAAPPGVGGALASRIPEFPTRAHRQCCPRPASARRIWRGDGRSASQIPRET